MTNSKMIFIKKTKLKRTNENIEKFYYVELIFLPYKAYSWKKKKNNF